jgi:cation transport ATPase
LQCRNTEVFSCFSAFSCRPILTDITHRALELAVNLARQRFGAQVTLMHVVERVPNLEDHELRDFYDRLKKDACGRIQQLVGEVAGAGARDRHRRPRVWPSERDHDRSRRRRDHGHVAEARRRASPHRSRMRRIALESAIGGMAFSVIGMTIAAAGFLPPVSGAVFQEIIDLAAVLNALRASVSSSALSDY